jgi:hypothetical protein
MNKYKNLICQLEIDIIIPIYILLEFLTHTLNNKVIATCINTKIFIIINDFWYIDFWFSFEWVMIR